MSETNLYKTVTLSQDQCLEIELAMLARIGQLREREASAQAVIDRGDPPGTMGTWRDIVRHAQSDLVVAHQVLTTIAQGRLFA